MSLTPCIRVTFHWDSYPSSFGSTTYRWSQRPMADAGEWTEGRLLNITDITRSCTDQDGNFELSQVTVELADDDALIRTLMHEIPTQFPIGREATIELLSEVGRALGNWWRPIFRGVVTDVQLTSGRRATITISDLVGSKFSSFDLERTLSLPLLRAEHPLLPKESAGKIYPIIVGEHSDAGARDANGNSAEKGILPVIDTGDYNFDGTPTSTLPPPSNVTISVHGTPGDKTYTYGISTGNSYGESIMSMIVSVSTGPAVRTSSDYIQLAWDAVPGATFYRVWGRSHNPPSTWLDGMNNGGTFIDPETSYRDDQDNDVEKQGPDISTGTAGDGAWGRLVVSLGTSDVHAVFASDLADGAEPKRVQLGPAQDGSEFLTADSAAWPHPNRYIELPSTDTVIRMTVIYVRGPRLTAHRQGSVTIAVNACGMDETGDGTGLMVDQAFRAGQLFLNEHILKDKGTSYRNGNYGPLETFTNGDTQIWTSAWEAAQAITISRIGNHGYLAAWAIHQPITVREWIRRFCLSFDCRLAVNHHGQIYPVLINDLADPTVGRRYREWVDGVTLNEQPLAHAEIENRITYAYDFDSDAQAFRVTDQGVESLASIAAHAPGGVAGGAAPRGLHQGAVQELYCIRDKATADDTRARRLTRNKRSPRYITHSQDLMGCEDDLGAQTLFTHRDGLSAQGDIDTPLCVLKHTVVPWGNYGTRMTSLDIGRLLVDGFAPDGLQFDTTLEDGMELR